MSQQKKHPHVLYEGILNFRHLAHFRKIPESGDYFLIGKLLAGSGFSKYLLIDNLTFGRIFAVNLYSSGGRRLRLAFPTVNSVSRKFRSSQQNWERRANGLIFIPGSKMRLRLPGYFDVFRQNS